MKIKEILFWCLAVLFIVGGVTGWILSLRILVAVNAVALLIAIIFKVREILKNGRKENKRN